MILSYAQLKNRTDLIGRRVRAVRSPGLVPLIESEITEMDENFFYLKNKHDSGSAQLFDCANAVLELLEEPQHTVNPDFFKPRSTEITKENLKEKDVITEGGEMFTVLGICGEVVFLSEEGFSGIYEQAKTFLQLREEGYKIHLPDQPKEKRKVTQKEVDEKFGEEVVIEG